MQIQKGWDAGVPECSTAAEGVSSDTALLWHGSLLWISTTGIEEREREREREKSVLPYHRCGVMTMSLQFLAQETIGGVSLDWAEIPSYPQRQAASITLHIDYVCFFVLKDDNESRKVTPPPKKREKKSAVCARFLECGLWCSQLSSTALRSLLPAARSALSGKKSQDWIQQRLVKKHGSGVAQNLGPGVGNFIDIWRFWVRGNRYKAFLPIVQSI